MNLILNIVLPLALLVGMNIRIYLTMQGQWRRDSHVEFSSPVRGESSYKQDRNGGPHVSPNSGRSSKGSVNRSTFRKIIGSMHRFDRTRSRSGGGDDAILRFCSSRRKSDEINLRELGGGQTELKSLNSRRSITSSRRVTGGGVRRAGIDEREVKKRDAKYTRASVVMVVSFVVCNTTRFVPNVMELYIEQSEFPPVSSSIILELADPLLRHAAVFRGAKSPHHPAGKRPSSKNCNFCVTKKGMVANILRISDLCFPFSNPKLFFTNAGPI